jgi:hypothetical protein
MLQAPSAAWSWLWAHISLWSRLGCPPRPQVHCPQGLLVYFPLITAQQTHLLILLYPEAPAILTRENPLSQIPSLHLRKYMLSEVALLLYCADCAGAAGRAAPEGGHG